MVISTSSKQKRTTRMDGTIDVHGGITLHEPKHETTLPGFDTAHAYSG